MFMKWLINTVISVPVLLFVAYVLIYGCAFLGHWLDNFEQAYRLDDMEVFFFIAIYALVFLLDVAMFLGALAAALYALFVVISGDGPIWRKVDKGDFLVDKNGSVVREFTKSDLILRTDPMFKKFTLASYGIF